MRSDLAGAEGVLKGASEDARRRRWTHGVETRGKGEGNEHGRNVRILFEGEGEGGCILILVGTSVSETQP